jgi:hypothetical protein
MKLPGSTKNWLTIIGAIIAGINLLLIVLLFLISSLFDKGGTSLGLYIYIILPGFFVLGLILIPIGMIAERKRIRKMVDPTKQKLPYVDLNDPRHRNAFVVFTVATIVILLLSTMGSFKAFHITESVEFCGTLCHKVMEPEYTAYQNSPHANVTCVECHVGSGADWYIKSKLSGLYQVYSVMAKKYPTPIETPLHDLRPARETCEHCHWPQKFYPRSIQTLKYFLTDSLNTEWDVILQMKLGPEYADLGFSEGIHWHINPVINIEYTSENDERETITRVKYTNKETGTVTVYTNELYPVEDSVLAASEIRTMDCIDCHNRPSHNYKSPPVYFDNALLTGTVSKEIPFIKKVSMDILRETFSSKDTALMVIHDGLTGFYKESYSDYYEKNKEIINSSIESIQKQFAQNTFPFMKVTYDAYPDHIGHLETDGCFRCHNDSFKSADGKLISKDCNLCHTIVGQGFPATLKVSTIRDALEFEHPIDIGTAWKEANCSECHKYLY